MLDLISGENLILFSAIAPILGLALFAFLIVGVVRFLTNGPTHFKSNKTDRKGGFLKGYIHSHKKEKGV